MGFYTYSCWLDGHLCGDSRVNGIMVDVEAGYWIKV